MIRWYWVSLSYATFGVGFRDGRVVETADINRWMMGKTAREIGDWVSRQIPEVRVVVLGEVHAGRYPW